MANSFRSIAVLALVGIAVPGLADAPKPRDLEKRAARIRPTAAELRWQQIPWVATGEEAKKLAKAENRYILAFNTDSDPLDMV